MRRGLILLILLSSLPSAAGQDVLWTSTLEGTDPAWMGDALAFVARSPDAGRIVQVAWLEPDGEGNATVLATGQGMQRLVSDGQRLVWQQGTEVWIQQGDSPSTRVLDQPGLQKTPAIGDGVVAWIHHADQGSPQVWIWPADGDPFQATSDTSGKDEPDVRPPYVVWTQIPETPRLGLPPVGLATQHPATADLYMYHLVQKTTQPIAVESGAQVFPIVRGQDLAYVSGESGDFQVTHRDLGSTAIVAPTWLTEARQDPKLVRWHDDLVVFVHGLQGDRLEAVDLEGQTAWEIQLPEPPISLTIRSGLAAMHHATPDGTRVAVMALPSDLHVRLIEVRPGPDETLCFEGQVHGAGAETEVWVAGQTVRDDVLALDGQGFEGCAAPGTQLRARSSDAISSPVVVQEVRTDDPRSPAIGWGAAILAVLWLAARHKP